MGIAALLPGMLKSSLLLEGSDSTLSDSSAARSRIRRRGGPTLLSIHRAAMSHGTFYSIEVQV